MSLAVGLGCDRKEKIIDVETPIGDVEVHSDTDDENADVDVKVRGRSD